MIGGFDAFRRGGFYEQKYHKDQPLLKELEVHAPLGGDEGKDWWVTGKSYSIVKDHKIEGDAKSPMVLIERWVPFKYPAKAPYKATTGNIGTYPNVLAYLQTVAKRNPKVAVPYKYVWQTGPLMPYVMLPAAGVLLLGLAWPATLALMQHAGLARKREIGVKLAANRDLNKPAGPQVDEAAVRAELDSLNADLETSLAGFGAGSVSATPAAAAEVIGRPIPALSTGVSAAIDGAPKTPEQDDADKEYGGEFYPVVRTAGHKD